jgi:hypothetical protein
MIPCVSMILSASCRFSAILSFSFDRYFM